jgi:3-oxoacyl-[acyl-carrier protein] reductase
MDFGISGKNVFISGGSHGIGLATAIALSKEGCNIAICSRSESKLESARKPIEDNGVKCLLIVTDVMNDSDIQNAIDQSLVKWGHIDILVNNVGGGGRWGQDFLTTEIKTWKEVFHKNVWVSLQFTQGFLPGMINNKWGRVIFVASRYGIEIGGNPWFNIAKVSQSVLMKNLSTVHEFSKSGVTFNAVAPGDLLIEGTGWDEIKKNDPHFEAMLEEFPMGRLGTAEEVACAIAFLCSKQASYISGTTIQIDGGKSINL